MKQFLLRKFTGNLKIAVQIRNFLPDTNFRFLGQFQAVMVSNGLNKMKL